MLVLAAAKATVILPDLKVGVVCLTMSLLPTGGKGGDVVGSDLLAPVLLVFDLLLIPGCFLGRFRTK